MYATIVEFPTRWIQDGLIPQTWWWNDSKIVERSKMTMKWFKSGYEKLNQCLPKIVSPLHAKRWMFGTCWCWFVGFFGAGIRLDGQPTQNVQTHLAACKSCPHTHLVLSFSYPKLFLAWTMMIDHSVPIQGLLLMSAVWFGMKLAPTNSAAPTCDPYIYFGLFISLRPIAQRMLLLLDLAPQEKRIANGFGRCCSSFAVWFVRSYVFEMEARPLCAPSCSFAPALTLFSFIFTDQMVKPKAFGRW